MQEEMYQEPGIGTALRERDTLATLKQQGANDGNVAASNRNYPKSRSFQEQNNLDMEILGQSNIDNSNRG
jgi:ribosomal protein L4